MAKRTLPRYEKTLAASRDGRTNINTKEFFTDAILGELEQIAITATDSTSFVGTKKWIKCVKTVQRNQHQIILRTFIMRAYGLALIATFTAIFLQGAGVLHLDGKLLFALATATFGQIGGLVAIAVKDVFKS